jgi:hypothetical protein
MPFIGNNILGIYPNKRLFSTISGFATFRLGNAFCTAAAKRLYRQAKLLHREPRAGLASFYAWNVFCVGWRTG